eukprot:5566696-Alexandrium_andersonii.AAC.1
MPASVAAPYAAAVNVFSDGSRSRPGTAFAGAGAAAWHPARETPASEAESDFADVEAADGGQLYLAQCAGP